MINKIIRNYLAKQAAGRADDGIMITLRDPQKIEMLENIMADLLMRNGIDPKSITSEKQLIMFINRIEALEKKNLADNISSGIKNTESAKIFDLKGREIPKGSKIMGGEAVDDMPPPGSRGGSDDIAAPVQSSEESLRDMIVAENKKNIDAMKKRKMLDEAIDNVSPSLTGDRKYDADVVAADLAERMGLVYDDMPVKERIKLYDEAYTGLTKKKFDPPEEKADGGRIGFSGGNIAKLLAGKTINSSSRRFLEKVFGKQGFENIVRTDPDMYKGMLEVVEMFRKKDKEGLKMYLQKFLPHMDDEMIEDFIVGSGGTEGIKGQLIRLGSGRDYAGKIEMMKKAENMRKLDDLEVTEGMIRKPNADGGIMRLGFKDGMNRRTFLKIFSGLVSLPIIGKVLKPLKVGKKVTQVPIIKTGDVPGKPEWFDQLVNKVILEGDDVTKRFATQERQVIHMKKIDDETSVMVTQDLNDGSIMVDIDDPVRNVMGEQGDASVMMRLKKNPGDESNPAGADEFDFTETDMRNYMEGPDDYTTEFTENTVNKMKDLTSDLGKIESYATGKKQTIRQFIESKKRQDKVKFAEDKPAEYAAERGPEVDYDPEPDFARGGIARMLGE